MYIKYTSVNFLFYFLLCLLLHFRYIFYFVLFVRHFIVLHILFYYIFDYMYFHFLIYFLRILLPFLSSILFFIPLSIIFPIITFSVPSSVPFSVDIWDNTRNKRWFRSRGESAGRGAAHGDAKVDQFAFSCYQDYKPKDDDARKKTEPKPFGNILKSELISGRDFPTKNPRSNEALFPPVPCIIPH